MLSILKLSLSSSSLANADAEGKRWQIPDCAEALAKKRKDVATLGIKPDGRRWRASYVRKEIMTCTELDQATVATVGRSWHSTESTRRVRNQMHEYPGR